MSSSRPRDHHDEFLKTELDSYVALLFHPLEAKSECHHHKLMVASDASSWKAPGLCAVNTCFDHDVVEPIVVFSSWAVPCPASTWFVWTRCVHLLQVVVTGEFYEPRASFVGLRVAVLVTYPLPVLACILSSLCIPVTPNYNNVFFWGGRLVCEFLRLIIEASLQHHRHHSQLLVHKLGCLQVNGNESARDRSASHDCILVWLNTNRSLSFGGHLKMATPYLFSPFLKANTAVIRVVESLPCPQQSS